MKNGEEKNILEMKKNMFQNEVKDITINEVQICQFIQERNEELKRGKEQ